MIRMKTIYNALDEIQEKADKEKGRYLWPILQKEFKKVCKRCKLQKVLFGNGTFAPVFSPGSIHEKSDTEALPQYSQRLWELCCIACELVEHDLERE